MSPCLEDHQITVRGPVPVSATIPVSDRVRLGDVHTIAALLDAARPDCVPMSEREIRAHLDEFEVLRDGSGRVVASAALRPLDDVRGELRGLAVAADWRGRGLGTALLRRVALRALLEDRLLVCVTRQRCYFLRQGFRDIPLSSLPAKPRAAPAAHQPKSTAPRVAMALPWTRSKSPQRTVQISADHRTTERR